MKFLEMMKKFFSLDEYPDETCQLERELREERHRANEYKKLAILKNQECVGQARLIDQLKRRIDFLEKVNQCQAELLADREV